MEKNLEDEIVFDEEPLVPPEDNPEQPEGEGAQAEEAKNSKDEPNGGPMAAPEDDRDARSVFVKNVHYSADKKEITEHFKDCGEIKLITIKYNKMTMQSEG